MTTPLQAFDALEAQIATLTLGGVSAKDFSAYGDRPLEWIIDELGVTPWSKQQEIVRAVRLNRQVAVPGCIGAGKDYVAVAYGLWWAYVKGGTVLFSGATLNQVQSIMMATARKLWDRANLPGAPPLKLSLEAPGGGDILARTSTAGGKLSGHHDPKGTLVIISEAQDVSDDAFEGLSSNAAGTLDRVIAIGNPTRADNWFARVCREGSGWVVIPISGYEHPNVVEGCEVIPGGITREYIADARRNYGEGTPAFRARVEGLFPESAVENPLLTRGQLVRCYAPVTESEGRPETVLGVDPGGGGRDGDPTVIAVKRGARIIAFETLRVPIEDVPDHVVRVGAQYGVTAGRDMREHGLPPEERRGSIVIDANGLGAAAAGELKKRGFKVIAFMSQKAPGLREQGKGVEFLNLRTAAYWRVRTLATSGQLGLLQDRELEEELLAHGYEETSGGKIALLPKLEVRRHLGRSPNKSDAVAYACWENPRRMATDYWVGSW